MSITIESEWLTIARTLPDPQGFIWAICEYAESGTEPDLSGNGNAQAVFGLIKSEIEAKRQRQQKQAELRERVRRHRQKENSVTCNVTDSVTCNVTKKKNPPAPPKEKTKKTGDKSPAKESGALSFDELIPASLRTIEFEIAWDQWTRYRREIKHSLTTSTAQRQLQKLGRYPPVVAIAAIDEAITNGWQGLFPEQAAGRLPVNKTRDHTGI